ncbi:Maf family protein [Desulfovibrio sp. OttesenSCG-928-C06]|nr:Maf family protein [Desulfovibrio sp. OttesenSCG-928-C06]
MQSTIFSLNRPFILASGSPRRRELLSWLGFDFTVMTAESESKPAAAELPLAYAVRAASEKACEVLQKAARMQSGAGSSLRSGTADTGSSVSDGTKAGNQPGALPQTPVASGPMVSGPMAQAPVVLGSDTIVVLDGTIYGKPETHAQAHATLQKLAGNTHEVITACCLLLPVDSAKSGSMTIGGTTIPLPFMEELDCPEAFAPRGSYRMLRFAQISRVSMWQCPDDVLRAYADSEEPMDKAGAYAVQGNGGFLIRAIEGSWSSVVGLPVAELTEILLAREVIHA